LSARRITRVALVAGIYAALTLLPPFSSLSYGPVQLRVSEVLTVLPFLNPDYMWGLALGCILGNLQSPIGALDIFGGSAVTLLAAYLTSRARRVWLAPLPPVVLNALLVGWYVSQFFGAPYAVTALYIAVGEAVSCYVIGLPLLSHITRNETIRRLLS
jgi:uncharacterized membrane protein